MAGLWLLLLLLLLLRLLLRLWALKTTRQHPAPTSNKACGSIISRRRLRRRRRLCELVPPSLCHNGSGMDDDRWWL
jgi:hypothetical protein